MDIIKRIFTKTLELEIKDMDIVFSSPEEFEFSLAPYCSIPLPRITKTLTASTSDLQLDLNQNIISLENINELLGQSPEISGGLILRLKQVNTAIFSKDNGWRDLFTALKQLDSKRSNQFVHIALKKYREYLINRRTLIEQLLKQSLDMADTNVGATSFRTGELDLSQEIDLDAMNIKPGMSSMPKGEPIIFNLKEKEKIILLISKYPCEVVSENGIKFIDHEGYVYPVRIGETTIGRSKDCSIQFPDTMTLISRLHLKIFNHDNQRLELMDVSSCGTKFQKPVIQ